MEAILKSMYMLLMIKVVEWAGLWCTSQTLPCEGIELEF